MEATHNESSEDRMDVDEVEDEPIHTIDVILNPQAVQNLYVLQYPLRPPYRPYDTESQLVDTRFKAERHILEMDFKIPEDQQRATTGERVLTGAGEEVLIDVAKELEVHTIRSSVLHAKTSYAVGLYRDNKLYLAPAKAVLQMRPDFSYIEKAAIENRKKKELAIKSEEDQKPVVLEEAKPVPITVRRPETEKVQQAKLRSWEHLKQQELQEPWKNLEFIGRDDPESYEVLSSFVKDATLDPPVYINNEQYLRLINPNEPKKLTEQELEKEKESSSQAKLALDKSGPWQFQYGTPSSLSAVRTLPYRERVFEVLKNTGVLPLDDLQQLTQIPEAELMVVLKDIASMIRGCYTLQSEVLHPGAQFARLRAARTWALAIWGAHSDAYVSRKELAKQCNLTSAEVKEMLSTVGTLELIREPNPKFLPQPKRGARNMDAEDEDVDYRLEPKLPDMSHIQSRGWRLKRTDPKRESKFADAASVSYTFWEGKLLNAPAEAQRARDPFVHSKKEGGKFGGVASVVLPSAPVHAIPVDNDLSTKLGILFAQLFEEHGLVKFDFVKSEVKKQQTRGEIPFTSISDELLTQELEKHAETLHGMFIKSSENYADKAAARFRTYVIDRFRAIPADQPKNLKRDDILLNCLAAIGKEFPPAVFRKVIQEIAFSSGKGMWQLKPGDGTKPESAKKAGKAAAAQAPVTVDLDD